jgi:hypothetical protein
VRVDAAGWGLEAPDGRTVLIQGALRPLAASAAEPPTDAEVATSLASAVSSSATGLELRPPLYGQDHAGGATQVTAHAAGWFSQLNTDVRRRFATGLAAWAVAVDQEDLTDRAWRQLADAGVPAGAAAGAMASAVLGALTARHGTVPPAPIAGSLAPVAAGTTVPTVMARLLRAGGPLTRVGLGSTTLGTVAVHAAVASPVAGQVGIRRSVRPTAVADGAPRNPVPPTAAQDTQTATRFCPTFTDEGLQLLQSTAPQWLLPGMEDLPDNAVVLLRTNPAFVESFLVGLNHALARELQWRRYPLDTSGTMFRRFWPATTGSDGEEMRPMAAWEPQSDLGSHVGGEGGVVLLVRGALLRRFPTTTIYLSGQVGTGPETVVRPTIEAYAGRDVTLVGFPMTAEDLLHPPIPGQTWSVVLQESVDHTRFGVDDAPANGTTATLSTWQDLDWANPHLAGATHVRVAGPMLGTARPSAPTTPVAQPPVVRWGTDSSAMAAALTRAPVRVRIPAALWLTPQP